MLKLILQNPISRYAALAAGALLLLLVLMLAGPILITQIAPPGANVAKEIPAEIVGEVVEKAQQDAEKAPIDPFLIRPQSDRRWKELQASFEQTAKAAEILSAKFSLPHQEEKDFRIEFKEDVLWVYLLEPLPSWGAYAARRAEAARFLRSQNIDPCAITVIWTPEDLAGFKGRLGTEPPAGLSFECGD